MKNRRKREEKEKEKEKECNKFKKCVRGVMVKRLILS
jgi:hypothetical protein